MAEKKRIAVGSDHAGFKAKETVKAFLKSKEFDVVDVGCDGEQTCDYPDFALEVAREVASGRVPEGILICGTGIGMSMAANKVAGIRAAVVSDEYTAEMSRRHNHANVFCAGARVLTPSRIV